MLILLLSAVNTYAAGGNDLAVSSANNVVTDMSAAATPPSQGKKPLDESRLWLPASYKHYSLSLLKAATSALARPRCLDIKRGTLDISQTTDERAVFRFLCLQANGQTYSEVIEGNNYTSLVFEPTKTPACYERLLIKVQAMHDLVWLAESGAPVEDQLARWDFDAKTPDGEPLHYQAVCSLDSRGEVVVKLAPRFLGNAGSGND